ncbi:MAG TPA: SpoIID/LytB domain-containing protein [Candidatus Limnocylindrales bacterium]|nr:SpoIID/LytB domain-containing protein [Candidatus Limnocylindrales bacterium]
MTWPTATTTLGTTVTFYGRGYGHGVGMNQYGAKGRAQAGQTATEILAAYFRGAVTGSVSATQNTRVLLMANYNAVSTAPLVIRGRATTWTIDGVARTFPADGTLKVWRTTRTVDGVTATTWRYRVLAPDGTTVLHQGTAGSRLVIRGSGSTSRLQLVSKPSSYDTYRGILKLFLGASTLNVVNHLPLDDYLRGVVPVEMSSAWPTEALKAQTIAARSYAVRRLHPTSGTYDLYDDTRSQVYRGVEAETTTTNTLIRSFPGQVIRYDGAVINAFVFSTGGGATENNEYVFVSSTGGVGSAVPYLRGIPDRRPDGTAWDASAPVYAWQTSTLTRSQLSAMFKQDSRTNVGDLTKLGLTKRGVSGRLYRVTLYGSAGSKTVSADVFRSVYNARRPAGTLSLRSNLFDSKPIAGS